MDAVAEMSGRRRRMVKQANGSYKYCLRSSEAVALEKVLHLTPCLIKLLFPGHCLHVFGGGCRTICLLQSDT